MARGVRRARAGRRARRPDRRRHGRLGGRRRGSRSARSGARLRRPLVVADGYALPGWAGPSTLVLCSSYSGDTEETLSAYDDAVARGAPRLVATTGGALAERARRDGVPVIPLPGGFQPRAAVGYSLVSRAGGGALCGAAPSLRDEIEAAAALAEALAAEWGPDGAEDGEAKALARALHGTVPVIAGAELAAAGRVPLEVPVQRERRAAGVRLGAAGGRPQRGRRLGRGARARPVLVVSLEDPSAHPRNVLRAELTAELAGAGADAGGARDRARRDAGSSGSSRSCCSATSCRSTSPCCAARTRSTSRAIDALKAALAAARSAPRASGAFSVPADWCWPATVAAMSSIASEPAAGTAAPARPPSPPSSTAWPHRRPRRPPDAPPIPPTSTRSSPRSLLGDAATFVDAAAPPAPRRTSGPPSPRPRAAA